MSDENEKPVRRRGAPNGNSNALRHGFYSRQFKQVIQRDLDGHEFEGLTDEITMLRVAIRQIFEDIGKAKDPHERMEGFRAVSLGCFSLARLIRTQQIITPAGDDLYAAISEGLESALKDIQEGKTSPPQIDRSVNDPI
jgi:hypothetical protein